LPHILPHIKIRVTVDVSPSDLDLIKGGGAAGRRGLRLRAGLLDWLADLMRWSFQKSPLVPFKNLPKKASPRADEGLRKKTNVKCTPEEVFS
jgi:hypothetical protein